ncbi:MAG TPA: aldehyde dehydrogenase family protein, partial [Pseudonocardia sp.]|uniref:aldehyde dehydrogenase family protein n=1 Tax=Pseudonocardia sp. TaxID=60912 RepID=UPI002CA74478
MLTMTINGASVESPPGLEVVNPATGQVEAHAPACTPAQLDDAFAAAAAAGRGWRSDVDARRKA